MNVLTQGAVRIRPNLTKPRDAEFTGRYHGADPIYHEKRPVFSMVTKRDDAGEIIYKLNRDGSRRCPLRVQEVERYEEREFVIVDLGNGMTTRNYDFRPDPEESARATAAEAAQPEKVLFELEVMRRALAKAGIDSEDLAKEAAELAGAAAGA